MFVCICHAVTDREVRDTISLGAGTLEEVSNAWRWHLLWPLPRLRRKPDRGLPRMPGASAPPRRASQRVA